VTHCSMLSEGTKSLIASLRLSSNMYRIAAINRRVALELAAESPSHSCICNIAISLFDGSDITVAKSFTARRAIIKITSITLTLVQRVLSA
jgi:hypothetical protein